MFSCDQRRGTSTAGSVLVGMYRRIWCQLTLTALVLASRAPRSNQRRIGRDRATTSAERARQAPTALSASVSNSHSNAFLATTGQDHIGFRETPLASQVWSDHAADTSSQCGRQRGLALKSIDVVAPKASTRCGSLSSGADAC